MSSSTTRRFPFHASSRRRRTIALFCSEDILLLSSAMVPKGRHCARGSGPKLLRRGLRDMKSEDAAPALTLRASNRLLAATTYATGDRALHGQRAETVET